MPNQQREADSNFRSAYSKAINHGFQALGNQISNVIINYIRRKYDLKVEETYSKPELMCEALERTLGSGALLIEKRIIKHLYSQLSLPFAESAIQIRNGQDFAAYIRDILKELKTAD